MWDRANIETGLGRSAALTPYWPRPMNVMKLFRADRWPHEPYTHLPGSRIYLPRSLTASEVLHIALRELVQPPWFSAFQVMMDEIPRKPRCQVRFIPH